MKSRCMPRFGSGRPAGAIPTLLGLIVVFLCLAVGGSWASSDTGNQVDIPQLERELMNPCENCGGKPLAGSYCGGAGQAKDEIRRMVDEGLDHDQIVAAFVAKYGEWILAVPERKGFNLFAWIFPVMGMVLGGGGLALFLKRTNDARVGAANPPTQAEEAPVPAGAQVESPGRMEMADRAEPAGRADLDELRRRLEREVRED